MAVLRKVHATSDVHGDVGIQCGELLGIKYVRLQAEFTGARGCLCLMLKCLLRLAKHEQPSLSEAEFVPAFRPSFVKEGPALQAQVADQRLRFRDSRRCRGTPKLPAPTKQGRIKRRLYPEG